MPATGTAPASVQAFTLDNYFNSVGSAWSADSAEVPVVTGGIVNPWPSAAMGLKAWRREWRASAKTASPATVNEWGTGVRKLRVPASGSTSDSNFYAVNSNTLTINAWDLQGEGPQPSSRTSSASAIYVQVAASYTQPGGVQNPVNPSLVFANYVWGPIQSVSPAWVPFPSATGATGCVSLYQPNSIPLGTRQSAEPGSQQQMNMGCLATLQFANLSSNFPNAGVVSVQIAIFITLTPSGGTPVLVFDDPEMDISVP